MKTGEKMIEAIVLALNLTDADFYGKDRGFVQEFEDKLMLSVFKLPFFDLYGTGPKHFDATEQDALPMLVAWKASDEYHSVYPTSKSMDLIMSSHATGEVRILPLFAMPPGKVPYPHRKEIGASPPPEQTSDLDKGSSFGFHSSMFEWVAGKDFPGVNGEFSASVFWGVRRSNVHVFSVTGAKDAEKDAFVQEVSERKKPYSRSADSPVIPKDYGINLSIPQAPMTAGKDYIVSGSFHLPRSEVFESAGVPVNILFARNPASGWNKETLVVAPDACTIGDEGITGFFSFELTRWMNPRGVSNPNFLQKVYVSAIHGGVISGLVGIRTRQ